MPRFGRFAEATSLRATPLLSSSSSASAPGLHSDDQMGVTEPTPVAPSDQLNLPSDSAHVGSSSSPSHPNDDHSSPFPSSSSFRPLSPSSPPASLTERCSSRFFSLLARRPVLFMLLFLVPSSVCLLCLFLPSGWSVSLDYTYDQFRIDGDSATWADNINAAARASSYQSYKPTQTAPTSNVTAQLHHSFQVASVVSELPPPSLHAASSSPASHFHTLQSAPTYIHRAYLGETLTVVYGADASAGLHNLLTSTTIRRIRRIEQAVMSAPGYQTHCRVYYTGSSMGECVLPSTVLNFMYPTAQGSQVVFDGRGSELIDPTLAATGLLLNGMNGFFDRACSLSNVRTTTLISQFTFGLPLPGYYDINDRLGQQRAVLRAWLADTFEPLLAEADGQFGMRVLREGGDIVAAEINGILMRDLLTVLLSVALVLVYMVWHTRSLFITLCSLLMMAASFPPVILLYRVWFGRTMSLMNVVSVWLILGIGTDDVFIFVDTWALYAKRQRQQRKEGAPATGQPGISTLVAQLRWTHRKAASAMLVTSLTTAAGFFSTSVSLLLPIRQFGFFLGAVVCSNYLLVITFLPAAVIAHARYGQAVSRALDRCCRRTRLGRIISNRLSSHSHSAAAVEPLEDVGDGSQVAVGTYRPPAPRSPQQSADECGECAQLHDDSWDVEVSSIVSPPRSPTATIQLLDVNGRQQAGAGLNQALLTPSEREAGDEPMPRAAPASARVTFADRVAAAIARHSLRSPAATTPQPTPTATASSGGDVKLRLVDRIVLGYFAWLCRVRWLAVLGTVLVVALLTYRIPDLRPPTELPQILPLDSNIEQLRHLKKTLACDRCVQGRLNYEATLPPATCPISVCSDPGNFAGCEDVDCGEGGVCQLGACQCKPGFFGVRCDGVDKCYGADCGDHGSCEAASGQCACRDGWQGDKCGVAPVCAAVNCGEHGSCSNLDGSCKCLDQYTGSHCEVPPASSPSQSNSSAPSHLQPLSADLSVHVFVLFGVSGVDMSAADNENPGRPLLDGSFDASDPSTQLHIAAMCSELQYNNSHARADLFRCPLLAYREWMRTARGEPAWPIQPAARFHATMLEWMGTYSAHEYDTDVGFSSSQPPRVVMLRVSTRTHVDKDLSGLLLQPEFEYWEQWMDDWNGRAPPTARAIQASSTWPRMKTELAFLSGTVLSLLCSVIIVSLSILVFTGNVVLMAFTTLCILSVVLCLLGLFVVWGWPLGALEAISVPLVVGLAVDYCLHLSHAYNTATDPATGKRLTGRRDRARQALVEIGPSITAAALTTVACMLVLLACRIVVFVEFGVILATTLGLGIALTLTTFLAALIVAGPNDRQGDISGHVGRAAHATRRALNAALCCRPLQHGADDSVSV